MNRHGFRMPGPVFQRHGGRLGGKRSSAARNITIQRVKCISPSGGINDWTRGAFAVIGGATGAALGAVATTATGGILAATVAFGAVGGAGTGVGTIEGLDHFFAGNDDLYIKVDGQKIWPGGKSESIGSQETKEVGYSKPFNATVKIELWEHDAISGDDFLGYLELYTQHQSGTHQYLVPHKDEGCLYELWILIE